MEINKSEGTTPTERLLADLCERSFLKLWSYPNPLKDDRDELCDLIVVFDNHVFIFFDRHNLAFSKESEDPILNWNRWKRKVIDDQTRTAHGAERYIRSGRKIFLNKELTVPFPLDIDRDKLKVHKIVIAHGAKDACKNFSSDNIYGSLGIVYGKIGDDLPVPFIIHIDRENPVHVFDTHNLPIIFSELDTFYDFSSYLDAKLAAIEKYEGLTYCGEEDLLAHYFHNIDGSKKHYIGTQDETFNLVMIGEGEWKDFADSQIYKNRKAANEVSYLWDQIIQRTCQNTLKGTLLGNSSPLKGRSAIQVMAKEPRFHRRALSERIIHSIRNFPDSQQRITRNLSFMTSFFEGTGYVFLQLKVDGITDYDNDYRPKRQAILEIACGAAKNKFDQLKTIVGIAIDAPKYSKKNSEDFILMDCSHWPPDLKEHYEKANEGLYFFKSAQNINLDTIKEFPDYKSNQ
jgi:hypothetical protein